VRVRPRIRSPAFRLSIRTLFRLIFETGLRVSEALGLHLEDLDLMTDDEHLNVLGKGGRRRTVLLDDARLVGQLPAYLRQTGYRNGPLFRAEKTGRGGPLRYQSVQERWAGYCARAAGSAARSTNCVTRTRPSWSTEAWPGNDPQASGARESPDDIAVCRAVG
jgi:integrase